MGKSLNNTTGSLMVQRIMQLQPGSAALWGSMTVEGMMYHCTKITNNILASPPIHSKPTIRQRMTKIMVLYVMKYFPKGIKSGDKYVHRPEEQLLFETERNKLIDIVNKAAGYAGPISGKHPFFGPMQTKEWKRFMHKHLDHHLRQFGV